MQDKTAIESKSKVIPATFLSSFILVTFLFALWGFANDITNPMVIAFKNILLISNFESSLVQFAFYGGYCVMAIPAALFIKRFTYKTGILIGLALYATGCLLFIPSGWMMQFWAFLLSYFIMTCGLSFLETSANPYILAMGPEETSTQRLNFAQSFNPMGSITGMIIASQVILISLNSTTEPGRRHLEELSNGSVHHAQVYKESIELIGNAQKELTKAQGSELKSRTLTKISKSVEQAQNRLSCLDAQRGPLAIQLKSDLEAAEKQAPKLLSKVANIFIKDEALIEAQKALDAQNKILKDSFYGDRSSLDITIQAFSESELFADIAPNVLEEIRPLTVSSIEILQSSHKMLASTIKSLKETSSTEPMDLNTVATSIEDNLNQTVEILTKAGASLQTIPSAMLTEWNESAGTQLSEIRKSDLNVIVGPYTVLGVIVLGVLVIFAVARLPKTKGEDDNKINLGPTLGRLFRNAKYIEGVIAQAFYVGAQIMCWTFIIQYGVNELGLERATAQNYNILAMAIFVSSRFICTFLLKFFSPGGLLMTLSIGGFALVGGAIFITGMTGLYCLIGVSACMSLMFPTIYGIALKGLGDDAKLGAAGLIMAIGGGSVLPPLQAKIMDMGMFDFGFMTLSSTRASFVLPLICFIVIAIFGFRTSNIHGHK